MFFTHCLPSVNLEIIIDATESPVAFNRVAIGSTKVPMIIAGGNASIGKPYAEINSNSPTYPPFGIPPSTMLTNTVMPNARIIASAVFKSLPKRANTTAILTIEEMLEPSLCSVAPSGIVTLAI